MSKTLTSIAVATVVLIAAFVLNPPAEKHRTRIADAIGERSQLEKFLGVGQLAAFVSRYHSVGVASYTTVDEKILSVGVLGMVFVTE